ncbi:MAG: prolyl oligopeptidase family serine peptidase [bacterium]
MGRILLLLLLAIAAYGVCLQKFSTPRAPAGPPPESAAAPAAVPVPPARAEYGRTVKGKAGYEYLAYLPAGYGMPGQRWPLIVMLHGQSMGGNLDSFKLYGPIKYGLEHERFPFVVVSPSTAGGWDTNLLNSFLGIALSQLPGIDTDRLYLTGYSMGGHAAWRWACADPRRFAAMATACGVGNPHEAVRKLQELPVWVFQGALDDIVSPSRGMQMIGAMKAAKGQVRYTIFPDQGHFILGPVYDNPELYDWFLSHTKRSGKGKIEEARIAERNINRAEISSATK